MMVFACIRRSWHIYLSSSPAMFALVRDKPFLSCPISLLQPDAWSIALLYNYDTTSQVLLGINLCMQLYSVFVLLHASQQHTLTPEYFLSLLVAKSGAGIAVLYMWKNWGVIDVCTKTLNSLHLVDLSFSGTGCRRLPKW
jgi:hypothetical protein